MKKKASFNQRTLRLLTLLAVLSGAVIICMFYVVEKNQIRKRATNALEDFAVNPGGDYGEISPEIYFVSTQDLSDDSLAELDRELLAYYLKYEETIPLEKVRHFSGGRLEAYFFARAAAPVGETSDGILLIYTDVSFSADLIRTAVSIMAVVFLILSGILCLVGHYTGKVLDEKDRTMKEFFANASHELKTPLMAIRSYAEGWRSGLEEQEKACSVIMEETDRMGSLVETILEFSKLDSGTIKLHMAENDVREILYDAIRVIEQIAEQKEIGIVLHLPEPILLVCDEDMVFSACSNILTNCVRYAENNITISAGYKNGSSVVRICITNDGKQPAREDIPHLFERFYKGAGGQTGIGLALSAEYVKLHGGDISASVEDGRTVFEIVIGQMC